MNQNIEIFIMPWFKCYGGALSAVHAQTPFQNNYYYLHVGDSATGNGGLDREIWAPDPPAAFSAFELKGI
jgi:hypothetical protein